MEKWEFGSDDEKLGKFFRALGVKLEKRMIWGWVFSKKEVEEANAKVNKSIPKFLDQILPVLLQNIHW